MTYDQFWNDDPMLAAYYRKAHEMREQRKNEELWWQGLYVYSAIQALVPALSPVLKKGAKTPPYPDKPLPRTQKEVREQREAEERARYQRVRQAMFERMAKINQHIRNAESEARDNGS